jgi:hypothetical protein
MSLNRKYRINLTNNSLILSRIDTVKPEVLQYTLVDNLINPKSIIVNKNGQLSVIDDKNKELYVFPKTPVFSKYISCYIYISDTGIFTIKKTFDENILYTENLDKYFNYIK